MQNRIIQATETGHPIVDKATLFLSYTGRYELSNFLELMEDMRGEYIWMDLFCVDQFAWTGQKDSEIIVQLRKELIDGLKHQIRDIGKVALMMEKWDEVLYTVGQVWVLWEVFNTAEAKVEFTILMTAEEKQRYLESFKGPKKFARIQRALGDIDCSKAQSEDSLAKVDILDRVKEKGFHETSCKVSEQVREWYLRVGLDHAEQNIDPENVNEVHFINNLALLLSNLGRLSEAEPLHRQALTTRTRGVGGPTPQYATHP